MKSIKKLIKGEVHGWLLNNIVRPLQHEMGADKKLR